MVLITADIPFHCFPLEAWWKSGSVSLALFAVGFLSSFDRDCHSQTDNMAFVE